MYDLKSWTLVESGASLPNKSISGMIKGREMGRRRIRRGGCVLAASNKNGAFTMAEKANLTNRFFPNRDELIPVSNRTLFRCLHLNSDQLVSLSQDNILNFHMRKSPQHYELLNRSDLPSANCNVIDIIRSSKGEHLAYATLDSYVYYFHIDRIREAIRWNLLHTLHPITVSRWNVCSALSFNKDDQYLFAAEAAGRINIINIEENGRYSFQAHQRDVTAIGCSKVNPKIFYTGSSDGFWKVWDNRTSTNLIPVLMTANHSPFNVANIDSDSQERYAITTTTCGTRIDAWDLRFFRHRPFEIFRQEEVLREAHCARETVRGPEADFLWRARFSPQTTGHRYVYANSASGRIYIFDITTGEVRKLFRPRSLLCDSSWHPENLEIACGTMAGALVTFYHGDEEE